MFNLPVKKCVKYLGIHICKDHKERQQLNFSSKLKKSKTILNLWLQRDISILGRILLTKVEGISRFVYPALSLNVHDSICKDINTIFTNFVWKNRHHHLKKAVLSGSKDEGGFELLDFGDLNYTFKVKWLKECLRAPESLWYFIPNNIFNSVGGLKFLLKCNYNITRLPLKLSQFYQQALLAWKLCHSHNFSPHKSIIWNNECITKGNKSLYLQKWIDRDIIFLKDLFDGNNQLFKYESFLREKAFPITFKEYNSVFKSIPNGILELMKSYKKQNEVSGLNTSLYINGMDIMSSNCTNKHIKKCFLSLKKITPRGKFFWNSHFSEINWHEAWLVPFRFCITNKVRELHLKILHNIYPTNLFISKFKPVDDFCSFCKTKQESLSHLFYGCSFCITFWKNVESYVAFKTKHTITLEGKQIITYFDCSNRSLCNIVNLFILLGKFHIHKAKFSKSRPCFKFFQIETDIYFESLKLVKNKKAMSVIDIYSKLFN